MPRMATAWAKVPTNPARAEGFGYWLSVIRYQLEGTPAVPSLHQKKGTTSASGGSSLQMASGALAPQNISVSASRRRRHVSLFQPPTFYFLLLLTAPKKHYMHRPCQARFAGQFGKRRACPTRITGAAFRRCPSLPSPFQRFSLQLSAFPSPSGAAETAASPRWCAA